MMEKDAKTEIQFRSAMDTAVGLLARRAHTTHELSLKLRKRRIRREIIERVVAECMRLNYLDDEDTARRYVAELKAKGYGRRHVSAAMRKKGLTADTAEIALEDGYSHSEEKEIALKMLDKKTSAFTREKDRYKRKGKIYRYLNNRGFSPDVINVTINKTRD
jgi:regulatory protein